MSGDITRDINLILISVREQLLVLAGSQIFGADIAKPD